MYKSVYRGKSKHKRNILRARKYEANMEPHGSHMGATWEPIWEPIWEPHGSEYGSQYGSQYGSESL